ARSASPTLGPGSHGCDGRPAGAGGGERSHTRRGPARPRPDGNGWIRSGPSLTPEARRRVNPADRGNWPLGGRIPSASGARRLRFFPDETGSAPRTQGVATSRRAAHIRLTTL